jgi:hypothetical protein
MGIPPSNQAAFGKIDRLLQSDRTLATEVCACRQRLQEQPWPLAPTIRQGRDCRDLREAAPSFDWPKLKIDELRASGYAA